MDQSAGPGDIHEFNAAVIGLSVFDRGGEQIGNVRDVSLDRTCILVEAPRQPLRRKQTHAVHLCAVKTIDVDGGTISLAASRDDVTEAPEFHQLDPASEATVARYYFTRLVQVDD